MRSSLTYRLLRLVWRRLTFSRRRLLKRIANGERVLAALGREVDSLLGVNTGPRPEDFKLAPGQFIAMDRPDRVRALRAQALASSYSQVHLWVSKEGEAA